MKHTHKILIILFALNSQIHAQQKFVGTWHEIHFGTFFNNVIFDDDSIVAFDTRDDTILYMKYTYDSNFIIMRNNFGNLDTTITAKCSFSRDTLYFDSLFGEKFKHIYVRQLEK